MNDDDGSLHFLLSGGHLSAARREHILDRVHRQTSAGRRRRWALRLMAGALPVAAAAAIVVSVVGLHDRGADPSVRIPKGAPGAAILQARCADQAAPGRCRLGDRILFEIDGAGAPGFLAAYAEDRSGRRIWYFPRADGRLAPIPVRSGHVVMDEAVRVGAEHAPGRYAVHLLLFDRAVVDRSAVLDGRERARAAATIALEVLP